MNAAGTADLIVDFADEALESLQRLPQLLEAHERCPQDGESINAVFRAIHSMKGCAGFLELTAIKGFAHSLESSLDAIRGGTTRLDASLKRLLIQGVDELEGMLHEAMDGTRATSLNEPQRRILDQIGAAVAAGSLQGSPEEYVASQILRLADELAAAVPHATDWAERFRSVVRPSQPRPGDSPPGSTALGSTVRLEQLRDARFFCDQEEITKDVAAVLELFIAHRETRYNDQVAHDFLEAADRFATKAAAAGWATLSNALRQAAGNLRTILGSSLDIDEGVLGILWDQLGPAFDPLRLPPEPKAGETSQSDLQGADMPSTDSECTGTSSAKTRFMRVREENLDEFLEQVSRLFITVELFHDLESRMAQSHGMDALVEEMRQVNRELKSQSTALQRGVVTLRRVAIGGLFSKFPKMARSLASQLGKSVDVQVLGEETEIDKVVVEDLDVALTHLIRNAVDHGIETPAERRARGASEIGHLSLKAEQVRNRIRITLQDDGRGIDPARLRAKAVQKGVLSRAEADLLSDEKAVNLIFHPGLSTAEQVSEISGRGVGMDAVRAAVEEHRGEVAVESSPGRGTTIRLEIPLRDAVVVTDALVVEHAGQQFILPFEHIVEISELTPTDIKPVQGNSVVTMRGSTYAAISLSQVLHLPRSGDDLDHPRSAVLVRSKYGALCLLMDRILGHRQAVINSLDAVVGSDKLSGVSPMGGGRLALVLNVPAITRSPLA